MLMGHENADIVNQALHILVELTDFEGEIMLSSPLGLELVEVLVRRGISIDRQWSGRSVMRRY